MSKVNSQTTSQNTTSFDPLEYATTRVLLQRILSGHEYFALAIKREISELDTNPHPDTLDILRARAFVYSHSGFVNEAIKDLNALVSQRRGRTARNLNKLAQVLTRRANKNDLEKAIETAGLVLKDRSADKEEKWFAYHNIAVARLGLQDYRGSIKAAESALKHLEDYRTQAILQLAKAGERSDIDIVRSMLHARGMIPQLESQNAVADGTFIAKNEPMRDA